MTDHLADHTARYSALTCILTAAYACCHPDAPDHDIQLAAYPGRD